MSRNRRDYRALLCFRQEDLERVPGQHDQIEPPIKLEFGCICGDPCDAVATWPSSCNLDHRTGRIRADGGASLRQPREQQSGAAPQVENGLGILRQPKAIVETGTPAIVEVLELCQPRIGIETIIHQSGTTYLRPYSHTDPSAFFVASKPSAAGSNS